MKTATLPTPCVDSRRRHSPSDNAPSAPQRSPSSSRSTSSASSTAVPLPGGYSVLAPESSAAVVPSASASRNREPMAGAAACSGAWEARVITTLPSSSLPLRTLRRLHRQAGPARPPAHGPVGPLRGPVGPLYAQTRGAMVRTGSPSTEGRAGHARDSPAPPTASPRPALLRLLGAVRTVTGSKFLVTVDVTHGIVTLTGWTRDRHLVPVAIRLARAVEGAVGVHCRPKALPPRERNIYGARSRFISIACPRTSPTTPTPTSTPSCGHSTFPCARASPGV